MTTSSGPTAAHHGGMRVLRWRGAGLPGSPIVLLHGLGDGADIWNPVLMAMPSGPMAAIAPDLPGHGGTKWFEPKKYAVSRITDEVARGLGREMVRKPVIIGHSLGGRVALGLVSSGQIDAERLILVDVNPDPKGAVGDAVSDHLDMLNAGAPTMDAFVKAVAARLPLGDGATLAEVIPDLVAASKKDDAEPGAKLSNDPNIKQLLNAPLEFDGWAQLAAVACPVAIIRGEFSSALDVETAQKMAAQTRRPAQLLTVPKAGHAIALEQPKALASALHKAMNSKTGRL